MKHLLRQYNRARSFRQQLDDTIEAVYLADLRLSNLPEDLLEESLKLREDLCKARHGFLSEASVKAGTEEIRLAREIEELENETHPS